MALKIGPIAVDPPVVLAPMAGITNSAFRTLCRSFGGGLFVSEMVSARGLVEHNARTGELVAFGRDEPVRSVQLHAVDPAIAAEAVRRLAGEFGVDHVDLNMGCPVPKVTRAGGGAAIPVRRVLFARIVAAAVRAAGPIPVTVKLRIGVDEQTHTYLDAARAAEAAGVAAVSLHARTASQGYSGAADWTAIARLKDALPGLPVVGNGDIWTAADAVAMVAATGCDGVMVGRGCLGEPWLFGDLADALAGRPVAPPPALGEVVAVMRRHARLLAELKGEWTGVLEFRKHTGYYLAGYDVPPATRRALVAVGTLDALDDALDPLDPVAPLARPGDRVPRGRAGGRHAVRLPDGWRDLVDDPTPPGGPDACVSGG